MADLTVSLQFNKSEISLPDVHRMESYPGHAFDPSVSYVGKMVALDPTTRRWTLASASATGTSTAAVVGLCTSQRGRHISVLKRGWIGNQQIDVSGLTVGQKVYVSNTAGLLADAAGTQAMSVGRVVPATDGGYGPDNTLLLYVDIPWN
jgi:hypothetical protein